MTTVRKLLAQILMLVAFSNHAGCSSENETVEEGDIPDKMDKAKAEEVRQSIAEELRVGAGAQHIEAFFERHNITYSYGRFTQRYNGIIRDVSPVFDQAIVIHIYVDDQRRFVRAEVEDSFTAL